MATYKEQIFRMFGDYVGYVDSYKDADNKGVFERFNEIIGENIDTDIIPLIRDSVANLLNPHTADEKYLDLILRHLGFNIFLDIDSDTKRFLITVLPTVYNKRGLEAAYTILFRLLEITSFRFEGASVYSVYGFDNPADFDINRLLDSSLDNTFYYAIYTYGTRPLTDKLKESIINIIKFCTPYYVIWNDVYYNDTLIYSGIEEGIYMANGYVDDNYTVVRDNMNNIIDYFN